MVVVLVFEPPALRPADRIPTLHVFTSRAPRGLAAAEVAEVLASTATPAPLALPAVGATDTVAALLYPPRTRVAYAGLSARQSGATLTVEDVAEWMRAPVVYVAFSPLAGAGPSPSRVAVVPHGLPTCCRTPQPTVVRPLRVGGVEMLQAFGANPPPSSVGLVAVFPLQVLGEEVDLVAYRRVEIDGVTRSVERRGRVSEGLRASDQD
mgnify:CR=1 FL=1